MSKPKQGPALFDLIPGRSQPESHRILRIPGSWDADDVAVDRVDRPDEGVVAQETAPPEPVSPPARGGWWGGALRLDGQRVTVSLTSYGAAIALFLVVVVFSAAFTLGQRAGLRRGYQMAVEQTRAAGDPSGELEVARQSPPVTALIAPLVDGTQTTEQPIKLTGKTAAEKPVPGPAWQRDHTYVVAQEFPSGKSQDAAAAQAFLSRYGIDAAVVPQSGGGTWLLTMQGYNHKDPLQKRQSDQLLEKVRSVGKAFYSQGGGYKMEGYFKTLKGDRW